MRILGLILYFLVTSLKAAPWRGFYLGGYAGAWFNQVILQARQTALSNWDGACQHHLDTSSALMGGNLGFLYPLRTHWILGVEGDVSGFFSPHHSFQCDCEFDKSIYDSFVFKTKNQGSIRGRLGYELKSWLPYFTAGASFANLGSSYTNEVEDRYFASQLEPGWILGAGLEWAYSHTWSLRLEYLYARYNGLTMNLPFIYGIADPSGQAEFHLSSSYLRAGLNFWLD